MANMSAIKSIVVAVGLLVSSWLTIGCSQSEEINRNCTGQYKDSLLGRWNCITNENRMFEMRQKVERDLNDRNARERAARPCVAADLNRM